MDVKLGFCVLVSLILLVTYGTEAREMAEQNSDFVFNYKDGEEDIHQQAPEQNSDFVFNYKNGVEDIHQHESKKPKQNEHMHSSGIFFLMDDIKLGKTLTLSFPSSLQMLPKKVQFSLKKLPNLVKHFSNDSPQAKETLRVCEESPIKGETKYCATSIEAMRDFVHGIMGESTPIITSTPLNHNHVQNYTILNDPEDVGATKMVACHNMRSVYYCHNTVSKSKVFKVELRNDENGDKVEAIAVCHLDTSDWNPSHVAFRVLGILPGTSPVCHFYPSYSVVWVPKTIATTPTETSL